MKKYLQIALMMLCVLVVTSCKDDKDDVIDDTWKIENEAAFQAKLNDPEFTRIDSPGNNGHIFVKKLKQGNGAKIYFNSRVTAYYKGRLINSKEDEYFDKWEFEDGTPMKFAVSSYSSNYNYTYKTGYMAPILGWTVALQNMVVGDKWEVWIPQELGYGANEQTNIPAYSTLIFEIEVMELKAVTAGTTDTQN